MKRRKFLKMGMGAVLSAAPYIVPSTVFGAQAPSNRITLGCIGVGGMGTNNLRNFMGQPDVQIVAVCDPVTETNEYGHWYQHGWNGNHFGRQAARKIVEDYYSSKSGSSYKGCNACVDFRELLDQDNIDAVMIATPDHWHAVMAVAAADKGKHIYGEKPLALTVAEGRAMVDAVRRNGVVFQTGTHRRSDSSTRFACELVRNGYLGQLQKMRVELAGNNRTAPGGDWEPMSIPDWLDYDMWLGPAPDAPYHEKRCLYSFRFIQDYSGGQTTNNGVHAFDICQWGNGSDKTGPVKIEDLGGIYPQDGLFDVVEYIHFRATYANGVELTCETVPDAFQITFTGSEGTLSTNGSDIQTWPESLQSIKIKPDDIHLYESHNHYRNFIDAIKYHIEPAAPVETGHYSTIIPHVGNIVMKLKRTLHWDPDKELFVGDAQANRYLSTPLRGVWRI
ncbi:Gfo/Idh/MocA family oxidoreductase [candidate division KSB1 bacterium]|nr:Gfo/Idh/MocA family oxidoreductase [candidate division KSB1 bacterium]